MNKTLLAAVHSLSNQISQAFPSINKLKPVRVLVCATALTIASLITGCATTTAASNAPNQSGLTYSGGGPSSSTPLSGPAYYQSDENPFHAD